MIRANHQCLERWSPVGTQLRHVVEHARRRDVTIETSRSRAAAVIRELMAQLAAAVHHFALITLLVAEFGMAPSTVSHARASR